MTKSCVVVLSLLSHVTLGSRAFVATPPMAVRMRQISITRMDHAHLSPISSTQQTATAANDGLSTLDTTFGGGDPVAQVEKLDALVEAGGFRLWKSAWERDTSTMQPFTVSDLMLEQRSSGTITDEILGLKGAGQGAIGKQDASYATLGVAAACLVWGVFASLMMEESTIRTIVLVILVLVPVLFSIIANSAPQLIAIMSPFLEMSHDDPMEFDRICRHEAGHFLCGYLCGLPINEYSVVVSGDRYVDFYGFDERQEPFDKDEIATLSVVAMAGSVAEILQNGIAKGGEGDLSDLKRCFQRSKEVLDRPSQQSLTRWGALTAYNLISSNRSKYEALVRALKEKRTVSECVAAIES